MCEYINLWLISTADNISLKEIFFVDIICFHIREEVSIYPHLGVQGQLSNAAEQVMVRSPDCGVAAISSPGLKPLYNHSAPNRSQFSVCCTTRCCLHTHRAPVWVFNYMMNCCPRVALQSVSLCCSVDVEMLQLSKRFASITEHRITGIDIRKVVNPSYLSLGWHLGFLASRDSHVHLGKTLIIG